jgi:hypothetical protein
MRRDASAVPLSANPPHRFGAVPQRFNKIVAVENAAEVRAAEPMQTAGLETTHIAEVGAWPDGGSPPA